MKNSTFMKIVNTKEYKSTSNYLTKKKLMKLPNRDIDKFEIMKPEDIPWEMENPNVEYVRYPQTWYNSNKLLELPGFSGVKTGITTTAGSCLCVYFTNKTLNKSIITVVLGSKNIQYRWKDTRRLTLWADACMVEETARK